MEKLPTGRLKQLEAILEQIRASEPELESYYFEGLSRGFLSPDKARKAVAHQDKRRKLERGIAQWCETWAADDPKSLRAFCRRRVATSQERAKYWRRFLRERYSPTDILYALEELLE